MLEVFQLAAAKRIRSLYTTDVTLFLNYKKNPRGSF